MALCSLRSVLFVTILLGSLSRSDCKGQTLFSEGFFSWATVQVNVKMADRWRVMLDGSHRRKDGFGDPVTTTGRVGVEYAWNERWSISAGHAFFRTYPYAPFAIRAATDEHRAWEQVQHQRRMGVWRWANRLRIEQRLFERLSSTDGGLRMDGFDLVHRFRWRSTLERTLDKGERPVWRAFVYYEPFLRASKDVDVPLLDQMRWGLGLGRKLGTRMEIVGSGMFQWLVRGNGDRIERNGWMLVTATFDLDIRRRPDVH